MPLKFLGQDGGPLPRIDRYELVAEIASGGMASVYLARLVGVGGFERFFAIKRLHPHLESEEDFVSMFLDEARIVANIRHQHVVPMLEVGASAHGYYLVMEYIEGDTLGTFISRGIEGGDLIPPDVALRVVIDTLSGLHAAHGHVDPDGNPTGLVHRDVSPQNILVDIHGVARIADFGVARAASRLSSTRSGQLKGKVAYMAPEQARGGEVTPRSDVFAAGIVLWEALCGCRLFLADNEAVTLNRLLFEPIPALREVNPKLPRVLEQALQKALARDPAKRFATAADMAEALQTAARASHMLGTPADVRTYVRSVIGVDIERRRANVRGHLSRVAEGGTGAEPSLDRPDLGVVKPTDSSVSSAAMAVPSSESGPSSANQIQAPAPSASPRSPKKLALFVAASAALGLSVAAVGFFALREPSQPVGPALGASASEPRLPASAPRDPPEPSDVLPADPPPSESSPVASAAAPSTTAESDPTGPPATAMPRVGNESSAATTKPVSSARPPTPAKPPTTAQPPAAPTDLERNPYR